MEFEIEDRRIFHLNLTQEVDAELTYQPLENGRVWSIDSTNVRPELQGQGVAGQMLALLVERAQQQGIKLRPVCSYAKKKFMQNAEYQKLEWHDGDPLD